MVGKQGMCLIIVSAYRVCPQPFDATSNTVTAQQTKLLIQQGVKQPNPRKQFVTDLITQIKNWQATGKDVLIGMDTNENVDSPHSYIAKLFMETDLIDLHHHRYPASSKPATYQRRSTPIDLMAGSPLLASALTSAWILPFGEPSLLKGDHRLLGLEFSPDVLFGSTTATLVAPLLRGIDSRNDQHVHQFNKYVVQQCNLHRLSERLENLHGRSKFDDPATQELEAIDETLTCILTKADLQCRPLSQVPWSPEVHQVYLVYRFWSLMLTSKRTERDLSVALAAIMVKVGQEFVDPQGRSRTANLRRAQKHLKHVKRHADQL